MFITSLVASKWLFCTKEIIIRSKTKPLKLLLTKNDFTTRLGFVSPCQSEVVSCWVPVGMPSKSMDTRLTQVLPFEPYQSLKQGRTCTLYSSFVHAKFARHRSLVLLCNALYRTWSCTNNSQFVICSSCAFWLQVRYVTMLLFCISKS